MSAELVDEVGFAAHPTSITVLQRGRFGEHTVERTNDIAHLAGIEGWAALPNTA